MKEIVEAINNLNNPINLYISIISSVVSLIAVIAAIAIGISATKASRNALEQTKKALLLDSQDNHPFVELKGYDLDNELVSAKSLRAKEKQDLSLINEYLTLVMIDLGVLVKSDKVFSLLGFELRNRSKAIISGVDLVSVYAEKPTKLEGDHLDHEEIRFEFDVDHPIAQPLLLHDSTLIFGLKVFFDNSDYLRFYKPDMQSIVMQFRLQTITGLKFFETIVFDGSFGNIRYFLYDTKDATVRRPTLTGNKFVRSER